jgi:peroxiredoxin (alkyl hydroperoxide reductase subunit C)
MSLVGKQFPYIDVKAIDYLGDSFDINVFKKAKEENKKIILFWYPKDFTFVCPTEIHAFQEKMDEFEKRNTIVIGASCDTVEVHFAWLNTPKDDGGIEGVEYPLISDTTRRLSEKLDILDDESVTYRATYLIDSTGTVFHESVNDMPIGRNVDEYIRLIDAKIFNEEKGDVCPANWDSTKDGMSATRDGVANYLSNN